MDYLSSLLASLLSLWQSFPTLPLAGKIGAILAIVIGLVKSSLLQPLWDKAGPWKALVAPVLGVVAALVAIQPLSWAGVWMGLSGGLLAVALSVVGDTVKLMPGVGAFWVSAINLVEKLLGAPAQSPAAPVQVAAMRQKALRKK